MASADLRKELECSVCLDIYTDPVTLICGHNFCQDCIGRALDSQEGSGGYSCPDCREDFQERPTLRRNVTLRNIVENVQSTHPDEESSGVSCTYCIHTPVPAVKSCLLCEASLCYDHLRVHSKSPEHVLCDLTTSLENRKYQVYKAGRPHIEYVEKCTGTHAYPHSTTQGKGHFNAEPSRRCPQPTQAIQPSRRYPQPSFDIQPSRRYPQPSCTIQPSRRYPQPSCTIQPSKRYPQPSSTIQPSRRYPQPSPTIQHSHRQAGGPSIGSVQQTSGVADIFWDLSTASNHLDISDDGKTVYRSPYKLFPETHQSFRCSQVMSITSFSSGRHYWEVDAGESPIWKVGMCYTSIHRRGFFSGLGSGNNSWCLAKRRFNEYSFVHDSYPFPLPSGLYSNRVRIELDYEARRISFYDLCDPIRHLHTFTTTFTEPLHAALRVGKDSCIRIIGGEYKEENLYRDW